MPFLKKFTTASLLSLALLWSCATSSQPLGSGKPPYPMENYIDLSQRPTFDIDPKFDYLFNQVTIDYPTERVKLWWGWTQYLGHPDFVQLDNGDILTAYPIGHGKGATVLKRSSDLGLTWSDRFSDLPENFKNTDETPTTYKLNFKNGDQKLIIISARPGWGDITKADGFDATLSLSKDENGSCDGKTWLPYENFYGRLASREKYKLTRGEFPAIVAMASLTHLKDANGEHEDRWMGIFHDYDAIVYKTFLTFNDKGEMEWSYPEAVLDSKYRAEERNLFFCEPEVVRSPDGNELAMIFRTNAKKSTSRVIFSTDEGASWSAPFALSRELTGERHKAEYCPVTGKLVITFRSIQWPTDSRMAITSWYSCGWLAWVGDYEDLKKGDEGKGDMVLKLAHTYLDGQTEPNFFAHADTGYAGLVADKSGMFISASYGRFSPGTTDTYVVSKQFKLQDIMQLFNLK